MILYICLGVIFFLFLTIVVLTYKLQAYIAKYEEVLIAKISAEKQLELQLQLAQEADKRSKDFEQAKLETMSYAKAAIFEVGQKLSSHLIEDHKREAEQVRKETADNMHNTTAKLYEQFQHITSVLSILNNQVQESKTTVDLVKRALLSPTGAGNLAEIALENILKASGLREQQDFIMQYNIYNEYGSRMRPDAVVFLPNNNIMVIDSKASKFFLEIDMSEGAILDTKLLDSMYQHLKDLTNKDYKEAVRSQLKKIKPLYKVNHITMVMFLPSELALEKLQSANKNFMQKAWDLSIFPSGPIGIVNMLSHARFLINENQQLNNYQVIIEEIQKLLQTISIMYEHAHKLGKTISTSMSHYDKFAGSFNNNLLSRVRKLYKLGLNTTKNSYVNLERYQIIPHHANDAILIEDDNTENDVTDTALEALE
ncbi:DNA recombination protein rmuC [Rickettsiales bacterium Ac37b]|nr:DNA recombination protein rmuC [Rickettsiales bacterium Ac37b]